jgi:hypothetical protein
MVNAPSVTLCTGVERIARLESPIIKFPAGMLTMVIWGAEGAAVVKLHIDDHALDP